MDSRLNLARIESQEADLRRRADAARAQHRWPDDGLPPRASEVRRKRSMALHPTAVLAALLTER